MLSCEADTDTTLNPEWSGICRTCLQAGEGRSIFDHDQDTQLTFVDKVMQCANVTIREQDNLPDQICLQCIEELAVAYRFRMNCDSSNAVLQTYLTNTLVEVKNPGQVTSVSQDSEPDDGDEIAIHLDSGVMYTYKPPPGLNVRLIHSREAGEHSNEETIDLNSDPPIMAVNQQLDRKEILNMSPRLESPNDVVVCKQELMNDATAALADTIESNDILDYLNPVSIDDETHSSNGETFPSIPLSNVKTLQIIRKTNDPNEMKPTIDAVMTQPAVDGIGVETVIRVKRNLDITKPTHMCTICNVTYKHKHSLEIHMRRHRGDRPYKCDYCDKSFVVPFELRRHLRIHTGQKPYKCKFCETAFADFGSKTKHERIHTGERPYRCQYCSKTFSYSHVLNSHLLTHTGVKRHGCTFCGKCFKNLHHLKAHYKTHYKQRTSEECVESTDGESNPDKASADDIALSDMLQGSLIASNDKPSADDGANLIVGWTLAEASLPPPADERTTMCISDGVTDDGPSVVAIVPEELENVSIINFGDYMMKTDALDELMVNDTPDDVGLVTVLLPKSGGGAQGTPFDHIRIIDD
uniref:Protein krueppel n=1 Tax=Anopheles farauti TaxID=69004 RepID=A0A182Q285_9DIPT